MSYSRLYKLFSVASHEKQAEIYYKLCLAISKEKAIKKYPELKEDIEFFISRDPSGSNKYLEWQIKVLKSKKALAPEIMDVTVLFHKYNQLLDNRDINSYKPELFTQLRDRLFELDSEREESKQKRERYSVDTQQVACGHRVIHESDKYKVLLITNKAASMHFGRDSKWCITMKDHSYFEDYSMNNVVFFFILAKGLDRSNPMSKIALAYQRNNDNQVMDLEIFNAEDNQISANSLVDPELQQILSLTEPLAEEQPKSLLAKMKSGELSEEQSLELYKKETDESTKYAIAAHLGSASTNADVLRFLYDDLPDNFQIVYNPHLPEDLIIRSLDGGVQSDVHAAANNPSCPIEALIERMDVDVARRALATRKDAPPEALKQVIQKDPELISTVLQNDGVTTETLAFIAKSYHNTLGFLNTEKLLEHPKFPPELYAMFLDGSNSMAASKLIAQWKKYDYSKLVETLKNNQFPLDSAEGMVKDGDPDPIRLHYIRRYVARRSTDVELLRYLFNLKTEDFINGANGKKSMYDMLSENPNLPPDLLLALASEKHPPYGIKKHPNITEEMVDVMLENGDSRWLLLSLLENHNLPPNSIRKIVLIWIEYNNDDSYGVLRQAIRNPNAPTDVIEMLAKSNIPFINQKAKERLHVTD